jgi:S-adenosylmethionine uptake transporter
MPKTDSNIRGVGFLVLGMLIFSLQDIAVKWIGGDYPILEIVAFRSVIAIPFTLLFYRLEGRRGFPVTRRYRLEILRGLFFFLAYTAHFMSLAALSLAEIAAIRYSGPLLITLLSVVWLRETVGLRRWLALLVGFAGVLLIVRPGLATFNLGSIFKLIGVLFYALATIVTRKLQTTDSSATQAFYTSLVYLVAAFILAPIVAAVGNFPDAHPSIAFLFHTWAMPSLLDWAIMSALGLVWAGGLYFISRAYSSSPASTMAPFEYLSLPISMIWDFVLWRGVPTWMTLAGALLTLSSGMYVLYVERRKRRV